MLQCEALSSLGVKVTLYGRRAEPDEYKLVDRINAYYGVDSSNINFQTYFHRGNYAISLIIAFIAVRRIMQSDRDHVILSRNLYASWILAFIFKRALIYETHQLEFGIKKIMQKAIMLCPRTVTVVISNHLKTCLADHHGASPNRCFVLHDAAPDGIKPTTKKQRRNLLIKYTSLASRKWSLICGYFGHLYPGRGIEMVKGIAAKRPNCLFLVYGGTESDLNFFRKSNCLENLVFMGHVPNSKSRELMLLMDVLLMPYQRNVSIGNGRHDTGRWMSPIKMFEYLASGVPIVSSDLPVLKEILRHGENCLLVEPDDLSAWLSAIDIIEVNRSLADRLGKNAHTDYKKNYTWKCRAEKIIEVLKQS